MRFLAAATGIGIFLSCCVELFVPALKRPATLGDVNDIDSSAWVGLFPHKNGFGHVLTIAALLLFSNILFASTKRVRWVVLLATMLLVILETRARTALIATVAAAFLGVMSTSFRWSRRKRGTLGVALALVMGIVVIAAIQNIDDLSALVGRNATFTGRTEIWSLTVESIERRPIVGYGYSAFWQVSEESARIDSILGWKVPYAHNVYLDIALQTGVLGIGLFLFVCILTLNRAIVYLRLRRGVEAMWLIASLSVCLLYGMSESDMFASNSFFWIMFVMASVTVSRPTDLFLRPSNLGRSLDSSSLLLHDSETVAVS
jgi:O-antigen ligase